MNPANPSPAPAPNQGNDMAAITNIISDLGPPPAINFDGPDNSIITPDNNPGTGFMGVPTPPAPANPAPTNPAPVVPVPNPAPATQPPATPGTPVAEPIATQPPAPNADAIPIPPAPSATPPVDEPVPAWAQSMMNEIAELKKGPVSPATPADPNQPAPGSLAAAQPKSWDDVQKWFDERTNTLIQQGFTQAQAQTQAQVEAEDEARKQADLYIDNQITQLESTGYLPKITNPGDPNDAGRLAHQELFAYAVSMGTDNLLAVAPNLYALHQSGYYFDKGQNKLVRRGGQSAAAQAPIAGASPSITPGSTTAPSMRDLATKDIHTLASEANQAYPQ